MLNMLKRNQAWILSKIRRSSPNVFPVMDCCLSSNYLGPGSSCFFGNLRLKFWPSVVWTFVLDLDQHLHIDTSGLIVCIHTCFKDGRGTHRQRNTYKERNKENDIHTTIQYIAIHTHTYPTQMYLYLYILYLYIYDNMFDDFIHSARPGVANEGDATSPGRNLFALRRKGIFSPLYTYIIMWMNMIIWYYIWMMMSVDPSTWATYDPMVTASLICLSCE